jgi:hypothetical protein
MGLDLFHESAFTLGESPEGFSPAPLAMFEGHNKTHLDFWHNVAKGKAGTQYDWELVFSRYAAAVLLNLVQVGLDIDNQLCQFLSFVSGKRKEFVESNFGDLTSENSDFR